MEQHIGIGGRFVLFAQDQDGNSRLLADFDNIITNGGLDRIGDGGSGAYFHVGSGLTAAAAGNTALVTPVARTNNVTTSHVANRSTSPYLSEYVRVWQFATGAVTGSISECGVGWSNSNANLFSRARIRDRDGDDTTVVVDARESLIAHYYFRVYAPSSATTGTLTLGGDDYDFTIRASSAHSTGRWNAQTVLEGAWTSQTASVFDGPSGTSPTDAPSGAVTHADVVAPTAYASPNYYRDVTFYWSDDLGALPDMQSMLVEGHGGGVTYQVEFDPPLSKVENEMLSIVVRFSWARHA